MPLPADWFCMSRKGLDRGGGLVHPKGENIMAVSWLGCENSSVEPFLVFQVQV